MQPMGKKLHSAARLPVLYFIQTGCDLTISNVQGRLPSTNLQLFQADMSAIVLLFSKIAVQF